jgi:DNA polymerase-3 subunit delta'
MWQVIGQARAVSLLRHSLESDTLSHAYLFVGPQHIGKMTLALNLAQALNCQADEKPCLECPSCKKIAAGNHSDVQVIGLDYNEDEDTERKLIRNEQIDGILHDASLPPFEGSYKVFIIDGAELLSIGAANRLLKTLEEPESKVVFVLLTTNENKLLKTVVSRCQRIELQPMAVAEETKALVETFKVNPERARLLASLSHGCIGWAITAATDEKLLAQYQETLNQIISIIKGDYEERFAYVAKMAAGFSQNRGAVYDTLDMWLDFWHDLMLLKLDCVDMITNIDMKDELMKITGKHSLNQIRSYIKSIESAALQLKQNVNARLALEVLMLNLPQEEVKTPR